MTDSNNEFKNYLNFNSDNIFLYGDGNDKQIANLDEQEENHTSLGIINNEF